jgi:ABC-type sugar transport system ATPase subunit
VKGLGRVRLARIEKRYGTVSALKTVDLEIRANEFFALLGPSGSGKTTTLRLIAGLETPSAGRILFDDEDVTDAGPGERDIAMVFQSYALYPHMTVAENIGFPLRMSGVPKRQLAALVRDAAARVRIDHLLDRRPGQLSGGQQQRCALARAIVRKPRLFLLDEPLSNLDAKLRVETRVELKSLQRQLNVTAIYVTHDQEEAMTLADRMAIFMDGEIVQVGAPAEIFARPATLAVAGFIGSPPMNLIRAHTDAGAVRVGDTVIPCRAGIPGRPRDIVLGVRPGDIAAGGEGLPAEVYVSELLGESTIVNLRIGGELVKMRVNGASPFHEGELIRVRFDADRLHLFERDSGKRIELESVTAAGTSAAAVDRAGCHGADAVSTRMR